MPDLFIIFAFVMIISIALRYIHDKARELLTLSAWLMVTLLSAQGRYSVAGVEFGKHHDAVVRVLVAQYGLPSQESNGILGYENLKYDGMEFSKADFMFNKQGKLNEAHFILYVSSKLQAEKKLDELEKQLSKQYSVSEDWDDSGKFVKGGLGPDGQSLFTIYKVRLNGVWQLRLRYGAFNI